jgi:thymidine phosphorylase
MKTYADASALARSMVDVGKAHGMRIKALITRMEEPLGWAIGNALEVMESVEILKGLHGEGDLARMSFRLAAEMLVLGGAAPDLAAAEARVAEVVSNGQAMQAFRAFVAQNGGDPRALDDFSLLPQAVRHEKVPAPRSGYIHAIDSRALGILAMELGAGRKSKDDVLDLGVGIRVHVRPGQRVEAGEPMFTLHASQRPLGGLPENLVTIAAEPPGAIGSWLLGEEA